MDLPDFDSAAGEPATERDSQRGPGLVTLLCIGVASALIAEAISVRRSVYQVDNITIVEAPQ